MIVIYFYEIDGRISFVHRQTEIKQDFSLNVNYIFYYEI